MLTLRHLGAAIPSHVSLEKKAKTTMHLNSTNSEETFLKDVVSGKRFFRVNTAYF